jgi:hypothetical protein
MDFQAAARRWAATWTAAWQAHDVEAVIALDAEDGGHRSTPFRPPHNGTPSRSRLRDPGLRGRAADRRRALRHPGRPARPGCVERWARFLGQQGMAMTLAGCAMARFDADGLTTQARDDRHLQATNG